MLSKALSVALFSVAAGCTTIDVTDNSVFFPTLRVSKRLNETWSIDAIADYGAGSDTQSVDPGQPIEIGGAVLSGNVDVDFDLTTLRIEGRARHDFSGSWLTEGFFGAGLYYVDVTATSGGVRGHDTQVEVGPLGGGRLGWRPAPRWQIYSEAYVLFLFPDTVVPVGEVEFGVEFKAAGPVSLLAGWRFRNLELIRSDSDFDFEWSGPFLGLGFDF